MERVFVALRAFTFMSGAVLLWVWVALRVRTFDQRLDMKLPSWVEIPGVVVMMLGGVLALLCVGLFVVQGRGTLLLLILQKPWWRQVRTRSFAIRCTLAP